MAKLRCPTIAVARGFDFLVSRARVGLKKLSKDGMLDDNRRKAVTAI
jgi:hypothetical protein